MNPNIQFWLLFTAVNLLSFLPAFLLDYKASSLIPVRKCLEQKSLKQKINYFFIRDNQDPFRINGDLLSFCAVLLLLGRIIPDQMGAVLIGTVLALSNLYLLYYYVMVNVYQTIPVLNNDLHFAKVGLSIATQRFPVLFAGGILLVLAILSGFFYAGLKLHMLLMTFSFPDKTFLALILLGMYNIYRAREQKYVIIHKKLLVTPLIHLLKNLKISLESRRKMKAWEPEFFNRLNVYKEVKLSRRPNIIIASLESYGAIIHELPELRDFFHPKLKEEGKRLEDIGWYASSILSKAPRISGGSWLSHSSFLYGMKIDEFALYESLMSNPVFSNYQSLLHVLKNKGYHNYYINPLGGYDMSRINWKQIKRMFAADTIINDESIGYVGQRTGSMGDSAPDQYAFHYGYEQIKQDLNDPYSAFFISNNSHYAWLSPVAIEKDWKALNHKEFLYKQSNESSSTLLEKYKVSINYQLDIFFNFIHAEDPDNTVLVLFGDHQPPAIISPNSTFNSPVHILSKNQEFVNGFCAYDFQKGLISTDVEKGITHQGFFSLFMKVLAEVYGDAKSGSLEYLPNGHKILG